MDKYPKIKTVFERDPTTKYKTLIEGKFALPEFKYLADNEWEFTEKVDGTNIRVDWNNEMECVLFEGRTEHSQLYAPLVARLQELFPVDKFSTLYTEIPMALYGEGYGARIQKGGGNYISNGVDFILFDVRIMDLWLQRSNVEDIADKLEIATVPIIGRGTLFEAVEIVREGFISLVGTQIAEGLVMRPVVDLYDRRGNKIITKIKHKDFGE